MTGECGAVAGKRVEGGVGRKLLRKKLELVVVNRNVDSTLHHILAAVAHTLQRVVCHLGNKNRVSQSISQSNTTNVMGTKLICKSNITCASFAENDKGENYYVIENIDVDRNLFHIIAIFMKICIYFDCYFVQRKKSHNSL